MAFFLFAVGIDVGRGDRQFLAGPYGTVADVQMLNFFRHLRSAGAILILARSAFSLRPELLVPLSLPLWRADGRRGAVQSGADSESRRGLYRLREVQPGVPIAAPSRSVGDDSFGGMHRLPGVCRGLSGGRRAGAQAPEETNDPAASGGGDAGPAVLWRCHMRPDDRALVAVSTGTHPHGDRGPCGRGHTSIGRLAHQCDYFCSIPGHDSRTQAPMANRLQQSGLSAIVRSNSYEFAPSRISWPSNQKFGSTEV